MQQAFHQQRRRNPQDESPTTRRTFATLRGLDIYDIPSHTQVRGPGGLMMPRQPPEVRKARLEQAKEQHERRRVMMREPRADIPNMAPGPLRDTIQRPLPHVPTRQPATAPTLAYPNAPESMPLPEPTYNQDQAPPEDPFVAPATKVSVQARNDMGRWQALLTIIDFEHRKAMVMENIVTETLGLEPKMMSQEEKTMSVKCSLGKVEVVGTVDLMVCLAPGSTPVLLKDCLLLRSKSQSPRIALFIGLEDALKIRNADQGQGANTSIAFSQPPIVTQTDAAGVTYMDNVDITAAVNPLPAEQFAAPSVVNPSIVAPSMGASPIAGAHFAGNNPIYPYDPNAFTNQDFSTMFPAGTYGTMPMAYDPSLHLSANQFGAGGQDFTSLMSGMEFDNSHGNFNNFNTNQDYYGNNVNNGSPWQPPASSPPPPPSN